MAPVMIAAIAGLGAAGILVRIATRVLGASLARAILGLSPHATRARRP